MSAATGTGDPAAVRVVALVGATAVGKTAAAIELCRRLGGEIIGADSVQVYRGVDVGSGKPTPEELGEVAHHLIDVVDPDEAIDAAAYAERADRAIADVAARGKVPVIVGGTGLWLRALLRGLVESPPVDPALRAELEARFRRDGGEALHRELAKRDPESAQRVHRNDMVRVVRALEYLKQTGRPLGEVRAEHALGAPRYHAQTLWLERPRATWEAGLVARVDAMLSAGWVEEVRGLLARYGRQVRPLGAVGYREVVDHLEQDEPLEQTRERIVRATRLYGKRQRTWFKSDPSVDTRLPPDELFEDDAWGGLLAHLGRA